METAILTLKEVLLLEMGVVLLTMEDLVALEGVHQTFSMITSMVME